MVISTSSWSLLVINPLTFSWKWDWGQWIPLKGQIKPNSNHFWCLCDLSNDSFSDFSHGDLYDYDLSDCDWPDFDLPDYDLWTVICGIVILGDCGLYYSSLIDYEMKLIQFKGLEWIRPSYLPERVEIDETDEL
jgi:hypothetical protein